MKVISILGLVLLYCVVSDAQSSIAYFNTTAPVAFKQQCGNKVLGAGINGKFYFLPTVGSTIPILQVFDVSTKDWSNIPIPTSTGVFSYLSKASMVAVKPDPDWGPADSWLVFGGGKNTAGKGTGHIVAYNINQKKWSNVAQTLSPATWDLCGVGCGGSALFATGDAKFDSKLNSYKPSYRQLQRLNLTTMTLQTVNMEKEHYGAACACGQFNGTRYSYWGGGQDPVGKKSITDQVEVWQILENGMHRVHDIWKLSKGKMHLTALTCGGKLIIAGGENGNAVYNVVEVWDLSEDPITNSTKLTYTIPIPVSEPGMGCLSDKYVLIAGGFTTSKKNVCSSRISLLDTSVLPPAGSVLPLMNTSLTQPLTIASAYDGNTVMFFDGVIGHVFTV